MSGEDSADDGVKASAVLRFLSELASGGTAADIDVTRVPFAWLGTTGLVPAVAASGSGDPFPDGAVAVPRVSLKKIALDAISLDVPTGFGRIEDVPGLPQLVEIDALHSSDLPLRLGWLFLAGEVTIGGKVRSVCQPLLTIPITLGKRTAGGWAVFPQGAWDLRVRVANDALATQLEGGRQFGGGAFPRLPATTILLAELTALQEWVQAVVAATGLPPVRLVPPDPMLTATGPLRVVAGYGVFAPQDIDSIDLRASLAAWAGTRALASSSLWSCLRGAAPAPPPPAVPVTSTFALTSAQEAVVRRSRVDPVTVVSGPPGTGKSHVSVAVAVDAVARGERVLMATRSSQAADVLASLLELHPGPDPVLFGGGQRASRLATKLSDGLQHPPESEPVQPEGMRAGLDRIERAIDAVLTGVEADAVWRELAPLLPAHREAAPRLFGDADLAAVEAWLVRSTTARGPFARWRRGRAWRRAVALAGADGAGTAASLGESLAMARVTRSAAVAIDQVDPALWSALDVAEERWRLDVGRHLDVAVRSRIGVDDRKAVAALAAALRAGRATRRRHLRGVDATGLTRALPLWIGTLGDIEELLPQVSGMFDLVILDEASQIDLLSAAPALLRGQRCVVVGDPRQLRFVSFLADERVQQGLARHGLQDWSGRLDVRRLSAFDLAASAAPVTFLDEHFRSWPHLIGFAASRFYDGRLQVATRRHDTEGVDCIDVRRVEGMRGADGVNQAEVEAVVAEVAAALATPGVSIGLVTPFRPQADAIERAVLDRFDLEEIRAARLRVGTVHAFQGDERDVMVLSLALDLEGRGQAFLQDPNLFNVLVTRARRRMVVVSSAVDPPPGLLADFLRWGDVVSPSRAPGSPISGWAQAVAEALTAGGTPVQPGYAAGRQVVDLCVGLGSAAIAVETDVHPEGFLAHRSRHLQLRRAGWTLVDAFPVRFDADPVAAAVHLAAIVASRTA